MAFKRIKKTEMNRGRNSEINKTITLHIKIIKLAVSKSWTTPLHKCLTSTIQIL